MSRAMTQKEFEESVLKVAGPEYTVLGNYVNLKTKIEILHEPCGHIWKPNLSHFLYHGTRCPACAEVRRTEALTKTQEEFEREVFERCGEEYSVLGEYRRNYEKIRMRHNLCGYEYEVRPNGFLRGNRCPKCWGERRTEILRKLGKSDSRGAQKIEEILKNNNIPYKKEVTFPNLKNPTTNKHLRYDFGIYDSEDNLIKLIEFNGRQHYAETDFENLDSIRKRDYIKKAFCVHNGIPLLIIPFYDIDSICLEKLLKESTLTGDESTDLLAFDQATTSGVSIWKNKKLVDAFSHSLKQKGNSRLPEFNEWLLSLLETYYPKKIVFEDVLGFDGEPTQKSKQTFELLCFYMGILICTCEKIGIPYERVIASAWKKSLGVKGQSRVEQKESCRLRVNEYFDVESQDACDAIGIGYHILEQERLSDERSAF